MTANAGWPFGDRRVPRPEQVAAEAQSALLLNLAKQVPGVIYTFQLFPDGRSRFPYASEALWDVYEVRPEAVKEDAAEVYGRVHPLDLPAVSEAIKVSAEALIPWRQQYRVVLPTRGLRWLSGVARPERLADGSVLWHGFITDVTEQRKALEELEASEARLRVQLEHAPEAIVVLDLGTGRFVEANPEAQRMFGFTRTEMLTFGPVELSPPLQPDGRESPAAAGVFIAAALRGETPRFEWTHRNARGDDVLTEVRLVRLPSTGHPLIRGSLTDVTERRRAEAALLLRDQAIATSLNGLVIADGAGTVAYVNAAFARLMGVRDASALLGSRIAAMLGESTAAMIFDAVREQQHWADEAQLSRVDGSRVVARIAANGVLARDGAIDHLMVWAADITEEKRLQAQFLQSQKMQTVGRLAGGVAHDFNNLLTVITGYLDVIRAELPADSPALADLGEVARAADTAAGLTRQLLAFSRKQLLDPRPIQLCETARQMVPMLQRLIGEDVTVQVHVHPEIWPVRIDRAQAEQILLNLAVNARDAMPRGGTLTITLRNVGASEHRIGGREWVELEVRDTGVGMTPEVRAMLFEPFFTTKPAGRGTGLGLAMVYSAVTEHGGQITVDSVVGRGSTFRILLPRYRGREALADQTDRVHQPRGDEAILLVEDEEAIRSLATRILREHGYEVHAFANGRLALEAFPGLAGRIRLVVTDAVMPELNGRELIEAIRATHPDMRVLVASGYAQEVIAPRGINEVSEDFLAKPYSLATLVRRVREALDRPQLM